MAGTRKRRPIEAITLRHFRGATHATEILFDQNKPITLIFGENGAGKSTIIDAIDAVCNRTAGSLSIRSSTDVRLHLASVGRTAADLAVNLVAGGDEWRAVLTNRGLAVSPNEPPPTAHILRRAQLLRLIEAAPAERYHELRKFIDVTGVEDSEQALRAAEKSAAKRLEEALRTKADADQALEKLWSAEGTPPSPDGTALGWAAEKAAADTSATATLLKQAEHAIEAFDAAAAALQSLMEARQETSRRQQVVRDVEAEIDAAESATASSGTHLVEILQVVRRYLEPLAGDACPICEQPIAAAELRQQIDSRLAAMTEISTLTARLQTAKHGRDRAVAVEEERERDVIDAADALKTVVREGSLPPLTKLHGAWSGADPLPGSSALARAEAMIVEAGALRGALAEIGDGARADLAQFNAISQGYERAIEAGRRTQEEYTLHERLEQAVAIVHTRRITFTQQRLDAVSDECRRLYQRIHPDETVGFSRFWLDEHRRASLHQAAVFQGHIDVPPQAYFSESHLDTLGFCLFLAIAKHTTDGSAVIVLDDIFTSVDAEHLTRIAALLVDECESFDQIILTTHQRQWRDLYANGQTQKSRTAVLDLAGWSPERGILHAKSRPPVEELREKLTEPFLDRQAVASKAGVLLEAILDDLALTYRCKVPRQKEPRYELSTLLDSVSDVFKKILIVRAEVQPNGMVVETFRADNAELRALFIEIRDIAYIRNQVGAHHNPDGANVPDAEVIRFGRNALRLADMLTCPACGTLAHRPRDSWWQCGCSGTHTRMTPRVN